MPELTLKAIEDMLDLKLDEKLDAKLKPIQMTLDRHTSALDGLSKNVKTLLDHQDITNHRLERLEHWAADAGTKIGIILEL